MRLSGQKSYIPGLNTASKVLQLKWKRWKVSVTEATTGQTAETREAGRRASASVRWWVAGDAVPLSQSSRFNTCGHLRLRPSPRRSLGRIARLRSR